MSKEKDLILSIQTKANEFKNDSKYKDEYEEYNNMKQTLSDNLYSKNSHFIYELIQNAEDNNYDKDTQPKLTFHIANNGILTLNNETGFNEDNIKSICKFSTSSKKGYKDLGFIGEKGLGFKSVFAIAEKPSICSNGYQFYFVEGEYTIPYWIDENLKQEYPKEFFIKNSTNIFLPFKKNFLYKEDIEKKIKDIEPIVILFLNKLNNIQIFEHSKLTLDVQKQSNSYSDFFTKTTIIHEKNLNEFYIARKVIDKPSSLDETKREKVSRREIVIAFPNFTNSLKEDRIFSFLPTEIRTNLPFLIQADFILIGNRENIIEDNRWNLWLLDEIVTFFVEVFYALQTVDKYNYLKYLNQERSSNKFIDTYYQKMLENLEDEELFLTTDEQLVKASNIVILEDFDFMFKYLEEVNYLNKKFMHKEFYIPKHIIKNWNIIKIDEKEFLRIIGILNKFFAEKFEKDHLLFDELLDYIGKTFKDEDILKSLPIIPVDENEEIKFYTQQQLKDYQVFFKLDNEGVLNNVFPNLKIISKKYREKIENIDFFSSVLGIKQPNISEILSSLDENFFKNIKNNVNFLVYIKNNYKQNEDEIIKLLAKHYQFLTKSNELIKHKYFSDYRAEFSTRLYISNDYILDSNSIENIVNKYCDEEGIKKIKFISEKYLEQDMQNSKRTLEELKKEWNKFFNQLKINDDLKLETEKLKMWDYGRHYHETEERFENISFFATAIFQSCNQESEYYKAHFNLSDFTKEDSVFLYNKILNINFTHDGLGYKRVEYFLKKFKYKNVYTPWIALIKDDFPIYIDNQKFFIKDIYLNVDSKLRQFFHRLPDKYNKSDSNIYTIKKIFTIKDKPQLKDILDLVVMKKIDSFKDVKSIFKYLHYSYENQKIDLVTIPLLNENKIEYIERTRLIWKDGKELGLIEVEPSYGDDYKRFFIDQLGVAEKPTIAQYIQHLKTKPKNYKSVFHKFVSLLGDDVQNNRAVKDEKVILIKDKLFSFDEIIFNDEDLENIENINNLLTIEKRYFESLKKIAGCFELKLLSSYGRDYLLSEKREDQSIYEIYMKLLNFGWDYIYSKKHKNFEVLKTSDEFILETKGIQKGGYANIILRINVDKKHINVKKNLAIEAETIYIDNSIDKRALVKEIAVYIEAKIGSIEYPTLERFYDKVYKHPEYSKEEYYKSEDIEEAKDDNAFDTIFEKISQKIEEQEDGNDILEADEQENKKDIGNHHEKADDTSTKPYQVSNGNSKVSKKPSENIQTTEVKKDSVENEKTICPECNVELNKQNLEKHLCKVHHKNCDSNDENAKNNQNNHNTPNLNEAIKSHDKNIAHTEDNLNPPIVKDEQKYREEAQKRLNENLKKSNEETKTRHSASRVKIGEKDTKIFLNNQYKGCCQICGFTFDKKDNSKYFELYTWLDEKITKQKTKIREAGSSLCLCANCHSAIKYGNFESKFIKNLEQVNTKISNFSFEQFCEASQSNINIAIPNCYDFIEIDMYKMPIRLLNKDMAIFYTEEHFLLFYNMLTIGDAK